MANALLLETAMDSDGNPWSLVIQPDGSAMLIYLGEQIAELDAKEGRQLLDQPRDAVERLDSILSRLEKIGGTINIEARVHLMTYAPQIEMHW